MTGLPALNDILEEYQLVDAEDRYRLLIDLGRQLEPMPDPLKTDASKDQLKGTAVDSAGNKADFTMDIKVEPTSQRQNINGSGACDSRTTPPST